MTNHSKAKAFYLGDYEWTLFPMETCRFVIDKGSKEISKYIEEIANPKLKDCCFLPQETVFAAKKGHHQRRTVKLDPVAEFYMYEMAYKNRKIFRASKNAKRHNFGYRFNDGNPIPIHESYKDFNEQSKVYEKKYKYLIKFDVSAYFNSIYHHDMSNWFSAQKTSQSEIELFGRFMREINSGFSIDFMPHGLYPSKMLGSHFLSYIDHSELIISEQMIRFMDDFIIFSDSKDTLIKDFQTIQKSLGQKSLNLNSEKTVLFSHDPVSIHSEVDDVKSKIMAKLYFDSGSGVGFQAYEEVARKLSGEEVEYLLGLLNDDDATDREASLILDCIQEHTADFYRYIPKFIHRYPYLAKKIFHKCGEIDELEELSEQLQDLLSSSAYLNEYQLFWIAKVVESYLLDTICGGKVLALIYEHKNSTSISKAKILEIPDHRFGMPEWREVHLKNGSSSWLAWSSAVGMRKDKKQTRRYLMSYFSKASSINKLIAGCVNSL